MARGATPEPHLTEHGGSLRRYTEMADYRFDSMWVVEAPIADAFDALQDYETHPSWWRHIRSASRTEIDQVDRFTVRYEIQSPLLYSLSFDVALTRAVRPHLIATRATGDLSGTGEWVLSESHGVTSIRHLWNVATTKPWMNAVAPVGRPAFRWAHDRVMERGARGLADVLEAQLVAFS